MQSIQLDGKEYSMQPGQNLVEVLQTNDQKLEKDLIALNTKLGVIDIHQPLEPGLKLSTVSKEDPLALDVLRHSTAHVMADAVLDLFPNAKITIGPTIENGFYYDFEMEKPFSEDDLKKIEKKMKKIAGRNHYFKRSHVSKEEAEKEFNEKNEKYKLELIQEIAQDKGEELSFYQHGNFTDLCRGPHLPSTKFIKNFKLLSVAGSYWRGDEKREQLQRIYGTAFFEREDLDAHLKMLEEAKKRDHRKIGKELDLFSISADKVGAGLVLWHPNGAKIREIMENTWKSIHEKYGYEIVYTPHIGWGELWKTSGHLDNFQENMYTAMDIEGRDFYIKPMNCPFHMQIFNNSLRSYRDLPMRYAEMGTVYRYERSGVLHGLMRVRGFTQDDAHIFCREDQVQDEILSVLRLAKEFLGIFGFSEFEIFLSTRPEKAVGEQKEWDVAINALAEALKIEGLPYEIDEGGGAFYGPKIDIKIKDAIGRMWQCGTVQFDFNLPRRFNLSFVDNESKKVHPYVIHRAIFGSLERFFGVYIEHTAGNFPFWIAPTQISILPITERNSGYSKKVLDILRQNLYRTCLDLSSEKLGAKIRKARLNRIPYLVIIGDQEEGENKVQVRSRDGSEQESLNLENIIDFFKSKDLNKTPNG